MDGSSRLSNQFQGLRVGHILQAPVVDGDDTVALLEVAILDDHDGAVKVLNVDAMTCPSDLQSKTAILSLDHGDRNYLPLGLCVLGLHRVEPLEQGLGQAVTSGITVGHGLDSLVDGGMEDDRVPDVGVGIGVAVVDDGQEGLGFHRVKVQIQGSLFG